MCSCISRSERLTLAFAALLSVLCGGAGCSAAGVSPAACEGYAVAPADDATAADVRWADYLRDHLTRRAAEGERTVPLAADASRRLFGIEVGVDPRIDADFSVARSRRGVRLTARSDGAMLWLQYQLMKSLGAEDARIEAADLPPATVGLRDTCGRFAFGYRSLYTPAALDADRAGILGIDHAENGWGLWGHQLDRVLTGDVPREVFSTVGGATYDGQFCFSAEQTFGLIERFIADRFGEGDRAPERFVIAPADDDAVCLCKACAAAGNTSRSATPAVAGLLRRLAARFPNHTFFTLGYLTTLEPPAVALPANTGVIVSAMQLPLAAGAPQSARGKRFAGLIDRWKNVAGRVFVWDYIQNFDDYLTPFPVLEIAGERLRFYRERGVEGVFLNGSGYDYVPFDDMRTYVLSALVLDPGQPAAELMHRYFAENYPFSGEVLAGFCAQAMRRTAASKQGLDLYGGIREAEAAWLDAGAFAGFYEELGRLLPAAKGTERRRLHELLTALSYTRLEVARRHGAGPFGFAERRGMRLFVRPETEGWLAALEEYAAFPKMKHVSESELAVGEYIEAWRARVLRPQESPDLLLGAALRAVSKPDERYADLGVLTDGVRGLAAGYHYGWHISSADLELEIPAEAARGAHRFVMSFLDLPRHRLRAPRRVEIYKDGALYKTFEPKPDAAGRIFTASGEVDLSRAARITVRAPRRDPGRAKIAADEIYLIP